MLIIPDVPEESKRVYPGLRNDLIQVSIIWEEEQRYFSVRLHHDGTLMHILELDKLNGNIIKSIFVKDLPDMLRSSIEYRAGKVLKNQQKGEEEVTSVQLYNEEDEDKMLER